MTDAALLILLDARITSILSGDLASWSLDGVTYTKFNIDNLIAARDKLKKKIDMDASKAARGSRTRVNLSSFR